MYTLGINATFHDSSACLVKDGVPVAAAEEERFTHVKHGKRPTPVTTYQLPFHAIDYCLREARIAMCDLDHVAYSFNPYRLLNGYTGQETITLPLEPSAHPGFEGYGPWEQLFLSYTLNAPRFLVGDVPFHLKPRFRDIHADGPYDWHFVDHHLAHAASAFLPSPFERAAVLTLDGRGEETTTSYWAGEGSRLTLMRDVKVPHSLGFLYEDLTTYLGFLHSSDEYKVMALAAYGEPRYLDAFRELICLNPDGTYTIERYNLASLFGPPREPKSPFEMRHFDIAASLQQCLEETVIAMAEQVHEETGLDALCLAGGVALNCVMNARLRDRGPFKHVWVQPAAGDAGTALGAALWVDLQERGGERAYEMSDAYLGPAYSDADIQAVLDNAKLRYERLDDPAASAARLLAEGKIVGWFQGRMEFGPRALGARSLLATPTDASMLQRLNAIKDREDFRPVAPAVLEEEAADWFENADYSPFMLFVHNVRTEMAERIPAVRHVDGTARIQTVNERQMPLYHRLIQEFGRLTGVPVVINTSFNIRGQPIVCSPQDALECFYVSPLDALVIGRFLLEK